MPRTLRIAGRVVVGLLAAAYPFLVWYGLTRWGARASALVLLAFLVLWGVRQRVTGKAGFRALLVMVRPVPRSAHRASCGVRPSLGFRPSLSTHFPARNIEQRYDLMSRA